MTCIREEEEVNDAYSVRVRVRVRDMADYS